MEVIKLRAWTGEKMIYRGIHDRNWYTDDIGGKCVKGTHPDDIHQLKTMLFTGLKDKNGVEIYEGSLFPKLGSNPSNYEVFYRGGMFRMRYKVNGKYADWGNIERCLEILEEYNMNYIIGNIHENPELI